MPASGAPGDSVSFSCRRSSVPVDCLVDQRWEPNAAIKPFYYGLLDDGNPPRQRINGFPTASHSGFPAVLLVQPKAQRFQ
jgi:hypothetical protein